MHVLKYSKTFKKFSEKLNNHYYIYSYIGIGFVCTHFKTTGLQNHQEVGRKKEK